MRKETLVLQAETKEIRNLMLGQFKECIEFAGSGPSISFPYHSAPRYLSPVPPVSKQPPPPLPPLNGLLRASAGPLQTPESPFTPPLLANFNDLDFTRQQHSPLSLVERNVPPGDPTPLGPIIDHISKQVSPEVQVHQGAQRVPSLHDPVLGPMVSGPPSSAQQPSTLLPSIGPGQVVPPGRSSSFGHQGPLRPGPSLPFNPATGHETTFHLQHQTTQPFPTSRQNSYGSHPVPPNYPQRPPSEPSTQGGIRKSLSTHSLASQYSQYENPALAPPIPSFRGGYPPNIYNSIPRSSSYSNLHAPQPRPLLPSAQFTSRALSTAASSFDEPSPPSSPVEETPLQAGPVTSTISAQMKCKLFLQQQHSQWKSLGAAKLKLYRQNPTNIKQLVVEAENKDKSILISTIVLTDGVERVGKTGVAIELSDKGTRTGIIYMIQLRNENSAGGLFDSLLAGSDRASRG